jgi:hypothetical protein
MVDNIVILLSVIGPLALVTLLWVMAQISRRFGEVTHRPPLYRGFYISLVLALVPLLLRLLAFGLSEGDVKELGGNRAAALLYDLPLALSITIAAVIAWRYWGWLVYAHDGQAPVTPAKKI